MNVRTRLERALERLDDGSPRALVRVNILEALKLIDAARIQQGPSAFYKGEPGIRYRLLPDE